MSGAAGRLALLLVALALGIALVEVGLRVHYAWTRPALLRELAAERAVPPRGAAVTLGEMLRPSASPRLVYELRPNLDVRLQRARVRTSADGWRGPELPREKPADTIRIVGIGDSVMFGWAVEEPERYLDRLARLLNERHPERRWEAVSLACPGYNLVMELEALRRDGLDLDPDLIVYGYVANDSCLPSFVADDADVFSLRPFLPRYLAGAGPAAPTLAAREAAVGERATEEAHPHRFCTPHRVRPRYRSLVGEAPFRAALEELAALAAEREIPTVLVTHPLRSGFGWPQVPPGMQLVYGTGEPGRPGSVVLPPALRVSRKDPHPNAAGHARIARSLFETLEARGVWADLARRGNPPPPSTPRR